MDLQRKTKSTDKEGECIKPQATNRHRSNCARKKAAHTIQSDSFTYLDDIDEQNVASDTSNSNAYKNEQPIKPKCKIEKELINNNKINNNSEADYKSFKTTQNSTTNDEDGLCNENMYEERYIASNTQESDNKSCNKQNSVESSCHITTKDNNSQNTQKSSADIGTNNNAHINSVKDSSDDIIFHLNMYNKADSPVEEILERNTERRITYNKKRNKVPIKWTEEETEQLLMAYEKFKNEHNKWSMIKEECGFENRSKSCLLDKYKQVKKLSQYYKTSRRDFVLVDKNNNIVLDIIGGFKIVREKWPFDAAKRLAKYYKLQSGDTIIIADHDNFKSIHKYVILETEEGKVKINALEARYNK